MLAYSSAKRSNKKYHLVGYPLNSTNLCMKISKDHTTCKALMVI